MDSFHTKKGVYRFKQNERFLKLYCKICKKFEILFTLPSHVAGITFFHSKYTAHLEYKHEKHYIKPLELTSLN